MQNPTIALTESEIRTLMVAVESYRASLISELFDSNVGPDTENYLRTELAEATAIRNRLIDA